MGYWKNDKDSQRNYRILYDDTFEGTLKEFQEPMISIISLA
ncbi:MAG: hypothetical protein RR486_12685 [Clostridium sp.]